MLFYLVLIFFSLSLVNFIYWPVQDYFVRQELLITSIPSIYLTLFILAIIIVLTLLQNKLKKISAGLLLSISVVGLVGSLLVFDKFYLKNRDFYQSPVIYKVTKNWGIQASTLKITGIRFFDSNQERGRVIIGDQELLIVDWRDYGIIARLPVPHSFGDRKIQVIRSDQKLSNQVMVEIKDPATLGN